jgi:hypothetical protein
MSSLEIGPVSDLQRDWWYREAEWVNPDLVLSRHIEVHEPLRPAALQAAVADLFQRHDGLRAYLQLESGEPALLVLDEQWWQPPLISHVSSWAEAGEVVAAERETPFGLRQPPLLRVSACLVGDSGFVLGFVLHHIIADGWGIARIVQDFEALYRHRCAEDEPAPAPASMQLPEWIAAEQAAVGSAQQQSQLDSWRERLAGVQPLRVPADLPMPDPVQFRSGIDIRQFPAETRQLVEAAARRTRSSTSLIGMAVFFQQLSAALGRPDVATMTIFNRRNDPVTHGLVGCIMNGATIAVTVPDDARELITRTRAAMLHAHQNQSVFVTRVWDATELYPGAVDALFIFDSVRPPLSSFAGFQAQPVSYPRPRDYTRFGPNWENFKIRLFDDGASLGFLIEYNTLLYHPSTIAEFADGYASQLAAVATAVLA